MKRYALWVKCVAFSLCVMLLLCVAVSGLGVLLAGGMGMYDHTDYSSWLADNYYQIAENLQYYVLMNYAAEQSESPQWLLEQTGYANTPEDVGGWFDLSGNDWYYIIEDANGKVVRTTQSVNVAEPILYGFENREVSCPVITGRKEQVSATIAPTEELEPSPTEHEFTIDSDDAPTEPVVTTPEPAATTTTAVVEYSEIFWDPYTEEEVYVQYEHIGYFNVTIGISKNYVGYRNYSGLPQNMLEWLFFARMALIAAIAISFCLFVATFILLMTIAGKSPKTGAADPKALNKLPLDLYLAAGVFGTIIGCIGAYELLDLLFYEKGGYNILIIVLLCGCGVGVATLDMGFFTALAAQFKLPEGYWWKHSVCGRLLKWIWKYVRKGCDFVFGGIRKVFGMLPLIWEWIVVAGILGIILLIICSDAHWYTRFPLAVWCLAFAAIVLYGGYCYGTIQKGIKRMREGNLNEKINTQWMYGSFKSIAEELNALADVVAIAAEKQLRSERMKTELITNVSHDIKTPLTSVINYVDLLQQPHTQEEGAQYLEVLSRQSQRLKKLVEDLMDMSKAASGNIAVNTAPVDAVETVNQALGEFADKLEAARLTTVFRPQLPQTVMLADGKLTWRVLSNLLSNVVKYALPGTRVYIDLVRQGNSVMLSMKNISREELNISADELTERFVRGDTSRNTEGSGLGLNIAQSLMRLQRGSMDVTVDGDLFKVTLTFPAE